MALMDFYKDFCNGKLKSRSYNTYYVVGDRTKIMIKHDNLRYGSRADAHIMAIRLPNGKIVSVDYDCPRRDYRLNPNYFDSSVDLLKLDIGDEDNGNFIFTTPANSFYVGKLGPKNGSVFGMISGNFHTCQDVYELFTPPNPESRFLHGLWLTPIPWEQVTLDFEPSEEMIREAIPRSSLLDGPFTIQGDKSPEQYQLEALADKARKVLMDVYATVPRGWLGGKIDAQGQIYNSPEKTYFKGVIDGKHLFDEWHEIQSVNIGTIRVM